MKTEIVSGIEYSKPEVNLLHVAPLVNAEIAGRTAYNSFDKSENEGIKLFDGNPTEEIEHSDLMDSLCHVYQHMSVAEHINFTYSIKGTSRAVLSEHSRHRIQSLTVRSTRYTMSNIVNAYIASKRNMCWFMKKIRNIDIFVTTDMNLNDIEIANIFYKFKLQEDTLGHDEFVKISLSKSSLHFLEEKLSSDELFKKLQDGKVKRNVGDHFKGHIVSDNWKVDMVVTFNLRSLKNYFDLRASNAAYIQIQWLAEEMIKVIPEKYLRLILSQDKINKILKK